MSGRPCETTVSTLQPDRDFAIDASFSRADFSIAARIEVWSSSGLPARSTGRSQLCWRISAPPVFSASTRAQASARSASAEKSVGTSTRRYPPGLGESPCAVSTGLCASRATRSATLPNTTCAMPVCPRVPQATRSAPISSARAQIALDGSSVERCVEAVTPWARRLACSVSSCFVAWSRASWIQAGESPVAIAASRCGGMYADVNSSRFAP